MCELFFTMSSDLLARDASGPWPAFEEAPQTLTLPVERLYHGRHFFRPVFSAQQAPEHRPDCALSLTGREGSELRRNDAAMRLLENIKIQCIILLAVTGLFRGANWLLNGHD